MEHSISVSTKGKRFLRTKSILAFDRMDAFTNEYIKLSSKTSLLILQLTEIKNLFVFLFFSPAKQSLINHRLINIIIMLPTNRSNHLTVVSKSDGKQMLARQMRTANGLPWLRLNLNSSLYCTQYICHKVVHDIWGLFTKTLQDRDLRHTLTHPRPLGGG